MFALPEAGNEDADWQSAPWRCGSTEKGRSSGDHGRRRLHVEQLSTFNCFTTRLLGDGVREHKLLSVEQAVHLLTAEPATLYGLVDRGVLTEGAHADVVVFDPATIASNAVRK